jgi:hypothetical protein
MGVAFLINNRISGYIHGFSQLLQDNNIRFWIYHERLVEVTAPFITSFSPNKFVQTTTLRTCIWKVVGLNVAGTQVIILVFLCFPPHTHNFRDSASNWQTQLPFQFIVIARFDVNLSDYPPFYLTIEIKMENTRTYVTWSVRWKHCL